MAASSVVCRLVSSAVATNGSELRRLRLITAAMGLCTQHITLSLIHICSILCARARSCRFPQTIVCCVSLLECACDLHSSLFDSVFVIILLRKASGECKSLSKRKDKDEEQVYSHIWKINSYKFTFINTRGVLGVRTPRKYGKIFCYQYMYK